MSGTLLLQAGDPLERDLLAIRRPARREISIDTGRKIAHRVMTEIVDADEAVVATIAHERNLMCVGRPLRSHRVSRQIGQLVRGRCTRYRRDP